VLALYKRQSKINQEKWIFDQKSMI
jgi:hypothetical protein